MDVVAQRKSLSLLGIKPHCPGHSLVTLLNYIPYWHCLHVINSCNSNFTAAALIINITNQRWASTWHILCYGCNN